MEIIGVVKDIKYTSLRDEILARATAKIRAVMGKSPDLPGGVVIESGLPGRPEVFGPLSRGNREGRVVELDYASLSSQRRRKVLFEPYGLLNHSGGWYVLGKSRTHAENRVFAFKVERIVSATVRDERFEVPADFDLRKYRGDRLFIAGLARVEVKLRLRGAAARRLGTSFKHARREPDGTKVVRFRDCLTGWLATWVLRQGSEVEVLAPRRLAEWVAQLARQVAASHASDTARAPSLDC